MPGRGRGHEKLAADDTLKPLISSEHATETVGDLDARKAALAKECPQLSGDDFISRPRRGSSDGAADKQVLDWLGPLPEFDEDVDILRFAATLIQSEKLPLRFERRNGYEHTVRYSRKTGVANGGRGVRRPPDRRLVPNRRRRPPQRRRPHANITPRRSRMA